MSRYIALPGSLKAKESQPLSSISTNSLFCLALCKARHMSSRCVSNVDSAPARERAPVKDYQIKESLLQTQLYGMRIFPSEKLRVVQ